MPAAKKQNKKAAHQEKDEDVDAIIAKFAAKRADSVLGSTDLTEVAAKASGSVQETKQERRNRAKQLRENKVAPKRELMIDPTAAKILDDTTPDPDKPGPALIWDPLGNSGPLQSIGAATHASKLGAVPLD